MSDILPDVLQLVFQQLAGDSETLLNISLTCRAWQWLALPSVYQVVDISRHVNDRRPQAHFETSPLYYRDQNDKFQEHNLIERQHAFLQLVTTKPQLASYVKSFTWVIKWRKDELSSLTDVDRQTWNVFSKMINVTHLDLSSVHYVDADDYVRQNPAKLFPKVRDLRLHGWMHRGLVRAILTSLNPHKLRSLRMDFLEDEGALPNGSPMYSDFANQHLRASRKEASIRLLSRGLGSADLINDDLIARQETGKAYIFPGPMWLPLHLLSTHALDSLTYLRIKVPNLSADQRSFHTLCQKTADFIAKIKETLESLVVVFAESRHMYRSVRPELPGAQRVAAARLKRLRFAKLFLEPQLTALSCHTFPRLRTIRFEGFYIFTDASPEEVARTGSASVLQCIRDCPFANASFVEISSLEDDFNFDGHHRYDGSGEAGMRDTSGFAELLANS